MSSTTLKRDVVMWDVVIDAHEVIGPHVTYSIPRTTTRLGGSKLVAKKRALTFAHSDAGVPPWKPYLRQSWSHVRVTRTMIQVVG